MAWIELHQAVWTHRKTFELANLLRLDETYAAAHLIRLWSWALDNAPDGDLSPLSDRAIAYGAGWRGDPAAFIAALRDAGWLDPSGTIHDWMTYAGRLVERRRADAERQRISRGRHQDVPKMSEGGPGAPDRTGPDRTGPDTTYPPTPRPPSPGAGKGGRHKRGTNGTATSAAAVAVPPDPAPASDADRAVWELALERLPSMTPGNRAEITRLEPIGRTPDGGLCLRAPPLSGTARYRGMIARALLDAGDASAGLVSIVEAPA